MMFRYRRSADIPALCGWLIVLISVLFSILFWLRPDGVM